MTIQKILDHIVEDVKKQRDLAEAARKAGDAPGELYRSARAVADLDIGLWLQKEIEKELKDVE